MKSISKSIHLTLPGLFVFVGLVTSGSAHACPGYYVTTGDDSQNVFATGVIYGPDPGGGIQVTINLHNPPNTVYDNHDSGQDFVNYSTSVNVQVAKGVVDGTYTATSQNYKIFYDGATPTFLAQVVQSKVVNPWVQIVRTSVSNTSMAKQNGSASFSTYVLPSLNCSGVVTVSAGLTYPLSMEFQIHNGDFQWTGGTATKNFTVTGGTQTVYTYPLRTTNTNNVSGVATITGSFYSIPSCDPKDPNSPYSKTASITVSP